MKRDALGRATKDSISYMSKQTSQKIKVVVDYENLNHLYKTGFSGRYEISSNGREKKFWLNGKLLQEDAYFIEFKKNLAKQSEEVSPSRYGAISNSAPEFKISHRQAWRGIG